MRSCSKLLATYESGFGDFSVCTANGLTGYEFSLAAAQSPGKRPTR